MSKGSFKIWLVTENGYEHTTPIRAFTLRVDAERLVERLQAKHRAVMVTSPNHTEPLRYSAAQIDLVTHDGAHAVHKALYKSVDQ